MLFLRFHCPLNSWEFFSWFISLDQAPNLLGGGINLSIDKKFRDNYIRKPRFFTCELLRENLNQVF